MISKKNNSVTAQSSIVIKDTELISILQALPIGIFIHQKGKCLFANAEACKILEEKSIKHIIGKYLVDYIIPNQANLSLDRMKRELRGEVLKNKTYLIKTAKKNEV